MLTDRDESALLCLAQYITMSRPQIQKLCYPTDKDGRITRRRLNVLCKQKYVRRRDMEVVNRRDGIGIPVYHLDKLGRAFLAEETRDDRYLIKPKHLPDPGHLRHALALTDTHMLLDAAIDQQSDVTLCRWVTEGEVINNDEPNASQHFTLRTVFQDQSPRLECRPDGAFMLEFKGSRGVFYVEQDRDRYFYRQVAQRKAPGYMRAIGDQVQRKHFPESTLGFFNVLFFVPTPKRRDALRRAFRNREASKHYMFASNTDVDVNTLLHEPVFYRCDSDVPVRLVNRSSS